MEVALLPSNINLTYLIDMDLLEADFKYWLSSTDLQLVCGGVGYDY